MGKIISLTLLFRLPHRKSRYREEPRQKFSINYIGYQASVNHQTMNLLIVLPLENWISLNRDDQNLNAQAGDIAKRVKWEEVCGLLKKKRKWGTWITQWFTLVVSSPKGALRRAESSTETNGNPLFSFALGNSQVKTPQYQYGSGDILRLIEVH